MINNGIRVESNARSFKIRDGESGDCFGIDVWIRMFLVRFDDLLMYKSRTI